MGVASGFVEPLEATSFYTWLEFLKDGLSDLNALFSYNENYINDINKKWRKFNNEVMNFIYFHYITKRSDTDFWKKFQDIENAPGLVKEILNKWQYSLPRYDHFEINSPFIYDNWVKVGYGLGLLNSQLIKDAVISNKFDKDYSEKFLKFRQDRDNVAKNMLANHSVFIKMMGASHES